MSNILAIETSQDACSVALQHEGRVFAEHTEEPRQHTQRVLGMVDTVLNDAGVQLKQLDAVAFGCGPGSFTGLRIAAGVTQGLAYGAKLPVIPVCSLHILAVSWLAANPCDDIAIKVAIDARMGELYTAEFSYSKGCWQVDKPPYLMKVNAEPPAFLDAERVVCIGNGWSLMAGLPSHYTQALAQMNALHLISLAKTEWLAGNSVSAGQAQPVYIRGASNWKKLGEQNAG